MIVTLMDVDNAIIIILVACLLASIAWRRWFRWGDSVEPLVLVTAGDTSEADRERGPHVCIYPPRHGRRRDWAWLASGLTSAGYDVVTATRDDHDATAAPPRECSHAITWVHDRRDLPAPGSPGPAGTHQHLAVIVPLSLEASARSAFASSTISLLYIVVTPSPADRGCDGTTSSETVQRAGKHVSSGELAVTGLLIGWVERTFI